MKTFVHGLMIDTIAFTRDHTCVPLGGSGLGFVIQDHTDHGASKERSFSSSDQLPKQQARKCRAHQRNRALDLKTKTRWPSRIEQLLFR